MLKPFNLHTPLIEPLIDALPCPIYYIDTAGVCVGCNSVFADKIMGTPRSKIVGQPLAGLKNNVFPAAASGKGKTDALAYHGSNTHRHEASVTCADGHIRQFSIRMRAITNGSGEPAGFAAMMLDETATKHTQSQLNQNRHELEATIARRSAELMTINNHLTNEIEERKKVEAALQNSENRYRRVFENTGNATILVEADMTISMANARAEELLGMPRKQFLGSANALDFVSATHRDRVQLYHELQLQGVEDVPKHFEFQMTCPNGQVLDIQANVQFVPETSQMVVSLVDITHSKALQRERQQLAAVIDQSAEAVVITDHHVTVEYVNRAFEVLTGFDRSECVGQSAEAAFLADQDREIFKQMTFMVSGDDSWGGRVKNLRKDNSSYIADTRIFPICDESGKVINLVCIKTDVTHEVQLEKQLQHAQKMEAIGTLAGGIAHDFNNILGGIQGYSEISLLKSGNDPELKQKLGRILDGCQRAKELIQNILAFSRKTEEETKPIEMQVVVKEALKLLRASIPSTIEFKRNIHSQASIVRATPSQIHQVVMNLCTNAAHAMQQSGGILEVGLENIQIEIGDHPEAEPGPYALLTVKDTGIGMDARVVDRIFEPYFTTKDQSVGTGLGLSVVHGIVKTCGGSISVSSEEGVGTVFRIYLPRIQQAAQSDQPDHVDLPSGKECVLVADDEQFILEIMSDMLASLGYQVETTDSGLEALQRFGETPDRFDLVIADLTMPKITGTQLAKKLKRIRKDIPIVLTTGMTVDLKSDEGEFKEFAAVLNKPILFGDLAKTLRHVLEPLAVIA